MVKNKEYTESRPFISYLIIIFLVFSIIFIYARYIGTVGLKVKEYTIIDENIPSSFEDFKILQFSDLEIGSTYMVEDLAELVIKINEIKPDIIVFTGDIISNGYKPSPKEVNEISVLFNKMDATIGKYSISGDDDTINGYYDIIINNTEFKDITNSYDLIYYKGYTPIIIYGLGSLRYNNQLIEDTFIYPDESVSIEDMPTYKILLAHEPDTINNIGEYNISLMLAGHSHNGEINLPYISNLYHIDGAKDYYKEEYKVGPTKLYVSGGLGTSHLHMRIFNKPSINVFKLGTK